MESLNKAELEVFGRQLSPTEYRALAGGAAFGQEARVFVASFKRQTLVVEVDTSTAGMHRTFVRDGTKTKVKHDLFKVEPEAQGKGVGRAVLKEQVQEYLRLGVSRIELDAAWVGQYTWLRMGFRLAGGFTLDRLRGEFRNWLHQNRLPVALARHPQSARDLAMLTHQGRKLGKEFLLWRGDSGMGLIPLQLDLDPEDNHFRAVAEYLGI
jgi:GNAT superfamily N-acetyltransferase